MPTRQRPGRTREEQSQTLGEPDTGSRGKAESAGRRAAAMQPVAPDGWPVNENGRPLAKVTISASELLPTGQYANVSVGPAQITTFIDLDRQLERDEEGNSEPYFSTQEAEVFAAALNQLAEITEIDVIAVQRNLILESIQAQVAADNGK